MNISPGPNMRDRRTVLYWLTGAFSALLFWKLQPRAPQKQEKEAPVKMLTEDGRLVEVDMKHLQGQRRKLNTSEIQGWVKRK
ncbi:hypothetical protein [Flavisolibacter tropicus]|uniref:Uncharacterized protein n=1 Tax=Flavisolibacter tropicus TaxID=1492898 RepID=A0A172TYT8_9BACT|nr:hypothetical protein [Flavisolibacter tropicus]ANE51953.1 hypothetical protein SY85_17100 [Flavisolibacter tropicus]